MSDRRQFHMDSKLMVGSELGSIDPSFLDSMSSKNTERNLQRPLISPTIAEPPPVSTVPCQHLKSENEYSMGNEISESGWTMYLDQSIDSWSDKKAANQFHIEQQQMKNPQYIEAAKRYPAYDCHASSRTDNEKDSSMVSDASTGPQKPPLPPQDIDFEEGWPTGSYFSFSRGKRGVHDKRDDLECTRNKFIKVDKDDDLREDLESTASCSSMDMKIIRNKSRNVNKDEDEHELTLLLQDTASSTIRSPERINGSYAVKGNNSAP